MSSWRALLRGDPLPWLLEKRDPAVRSLTLRHLLDRSPRDTELREAQTRVMASPPISTILRRQNADGGWNGAHYSPKYTSSHWSMLLLVEYGADPSDGRVRLGARRILEQLADGSAGMGWVFDKDHGASCYTANVVRYVSAAGYGTDARLEPLVQRLVHDAKKFDAACWINGELPCSWGYARLVWALSALPETARTREVERTIRRGVEFLLSYRPERGDYPATTGQSYLWRQLSFPLFYQADVLFVLRALDAAESLDDPRAQSSIAWLLARQDERGRWGGRAPYAARMPSRIDASKWVTLQAITLLKHAFPGPAERA
ncbi:MAG: terpene cyclase/mutase family protein [Chloroflexota bacterium]|nr:terpene cyclase/mutase family protein [Chloroflexota bacterium]MDE3194373.1 terpene cyclase/mutase family protein [Chloroflexota bacterium]